jgi:hypothetical protein
MSNTNKRKPVYPRDPEPPMRNTKKDAKRLKPSQEDAKRFKPSQENSSVYLIDGIPPVQTEEAKKLAATNKESNRKKAIRKNLASELIDESYPPSICPVCNEHPENGRSGADLHFKAEHSGVKAFKCAHPSCESCFSSRPGLKYHLEHAHTVTLASSPR